MSEKTFSNYIKNSLPNECFLQKIENGFKTSGFPDLFILYKTIPILIELKTTIKRNGKTKENYLFKLEKSQIAWHLKFKKFNGVSFFLHQVPFSNDLFLFDGYQVAMFHATKLEKPVPIAQGLLKDCLNVARKTVIENMFLES